MSTKSKAVHTPGPWRAELTGASPVKIIAGDDIVGYAIYGPLRDVDTEYESGVPTAEANARLIAGAPTMYEAMKSFVNFFESRSHLLGNGMAMKHFIDARAIITRIEGEEAR